MSQLCRKQQPHSRGRSGAVTPRGVERCRFPLRGCGPRLAHLRGSQCTSGRASVPTQPLPAPGTSRPEPRPPALAKVLKLPRRSAPQRAAGTGCESIRESKGPHQRDPQYPTQTCCDSCDSPVPLPAATRARRALSHVMALVRKMSLLWSRGNLHLTTQLGARKQEEIPRSRGYILGNRNTSQVQTVLGSSPQAMRQLGDRQGNFRVSCSMSLHVEEVSTGKLPFASVMNCSLSQIQNKEVINCLPAGTEKPRNPCDLWEEHPL